MNNSEKELAILTRLLDKEYSGRKLRKYLNTIGYNYSGPSFYLFISHMEEKDLVKGWYAEKDIDGTIVKERRYNITEKGKEISQEES